MMMNQHVSMPDYYGNSRGHHAFDQFGMASFAYRPAPAPAGAGAGATSFVQMPLRPAAELGLSELHHHHPPPLAQHVNHHPLLHSHPHQQRSHMQQQPPPSQQHLQQNMADWQTDDDFTEFQELSNTYEPEVTVSQTLPEPYHATTVGKHLTATCLRTGTSCRRTTTEQCFDQ